MSQSQEIAVHLLEAYSQGLVTRHEIQEQVGAPVSFGFLLGQLHTRDLPLPRFPSDRNAPGVDLVRRLAERGLRAG